MKSRTNCAECRKKIYKEAETEYLKHEYKWFSDAAYSMAVYSTVACLAVMRRRNRSRSYIRKFYDDICMIYDYPEIFGERIKMTDLVKLFETEYGIDFLKIKIHLETEKEFIRDIRKDGKQNA